MYNLWSSEVRFKRTGLLVLRCDLKEMNIYFSDASHFHVFASSSIQQHFLFILLEYMSGHYLLIRYMQDALYPIRYVGIEKKRIVDPPKI